MRDRRFWQSLAVKIMICAGFVAGVSVAVSAALASGGQAQRPSAARADVPTLQKQLAQCRKDLVQARAAVGTADELLALALKGQLVFGRLGGLLVPISVEQARDYLILQFVTGKITKGGLAKGLGALARAARATVRALKDLGTEARAERDAIDGRCADLAAKLKAAQSGGQKPPGSTGAFPGGTATKLTLTVEGTTVTTDLKSNKQDKRVTVNAKSDGALSGSVDVNGTLPPGWQVVVFHPQVTTVLLQNNDGGAFSNVKVGIPGFAGSTGLAAYICAKTSPWVKNQGCPPAAQANIDITWTR